MPNKNYIRGYIFEREVVNYFKDLGFTAERTAGSHSIWDGVATKKNKTIFFQCKRVKGKYYSFKKELKEFGDFETSCEKWFMIKLDRLAGRSVKWKIIKVK